MSCVTESYMQPNAESYENIHVSATDSDSDNSSDSDTSSDNEEYGHAQNNYGMIPAAMPQMNPAVNVAQNAMPQVVKHDADYGMLPLPGSYPEKPAKKSASSKAGVLVLAGFAVGVVVGVGAGITGALLCCKPQSGSSAVETPRNETVQKNGGQGNVSKAAMDGIAFRGGAVSGDNHVVEYDDREDVRHEQYGVNEFSQGGGSIVYEEEKNKANGDQENDQENFYRESNEMESNEMESNEMESNEMESNEMESNEMESNEMESNEVESNEMESNEMEYENASPYRDGPQAMMNDTHAILAGNAESMKKLENEEKALHEGFAVQQENYASLLRSLAPPPIVYNYRE